MNVMDRLFGRKPRTPDSIGATLAAAREALTTAQARAARAADCRKAAIASGDRSGAIAAEAERAAAEIDTEIATVEVTGLEKGLADAVRAAEAEARAALVASLVERRRVLGARCETEWRSAVEVLASIMSEAAELQRDVAEGGFDREVERLPEISRGLPMRDEAVNAISRWLDDALSAPPTVPESPNEAAFRETGEARTRRKAEEAEARRIKAEAEREEGRAAREAEEARQRWRERTPYYGQIRDVSDAAR